MTTLGKLGKDGALVPLRLSLGMTMLYHGFSKLRGEGPRQTGEMFEQLGVRPGKTWALLTGWSEVLAGASSILGIGTRLAALTVLVTQAVAVSKVHGPKGFSNLVGGYEFNAALMAMATALLIAGPGDLSAQKPLRRAIEGGKPRWKLALAPKRRGAAAAVAGLLH